MKELTLRDIQHRELVNLEFLNKICKQQDLTYFLAYGTLIGAIRHHGFIPWDDDTDVWMPRKDYMALLDYFKENSEKLKPFKICTRDNTKNYPYGIARLCDQRYKYVTTNSYERQFELGVFTDIYPLDNLGNDNNIDVIKKLSTYCSKQNVSYARYCSGVSGNMLKSVLKKLNRLSLHLIHGNNYSEIVNNNIINAINKNTSDKDKYIGVIAWDSNQFIRFNKEDFEENILVDFEGKKFPVPRGYDTILKLTYGDYMKFPPESERHPYHGYKIYKR